MFRLSLKTKMTVAIALMIVCSLSGVAFFALAHFGQKFRETIALQQFTLASALAAEIDQKIEIARGELISLARSIPAGTLADDVALQEFLDNRHQDEPIFDGVLAVFSPAGILRAMAPREPEMIGWDLSFRPYLVDTVATGEPQISAPFPSVQKHGHPIVMFTAPLFAADGRLTAVVAGAVDLLDDNFLGKIATTRLGEKGYLYLIARDRTIIVHPDRSRILKKDVPPGANRLFDLAVGGFEGTDETVTSLGLHTLSSFKHLQTRDWILAVNLPADEALAPIPLARRYTLIVLAAGTSLTLLATWLLMHLLTAPLLVVIDRIRQMTHKDAERSPIRLKTGDEIETLTAAFNLLLEETESHKRVLQDNLRFHQVLIDTIPLPVWYKGRDGRYLGCNSAFAAAFGHDRQELVGKTVFDVAPGDLAAEYRRADDAVLEQGAVQTYETRLRDGDGALRDVLAFKAPFANAEGEIVGLVGTLIDITERKRMEHELQRSRDFYLTIFEEFPALIWRAGLDAKCNYFNRTWLEFTGRSLEEELGAGWAEGVHPTDLEQCLATYREAFAARRPFSMEYRLRRADGEYRWILDVGRPFNDLEGKFAGYIGTCFDISERLQTLEQLKVLSRTIEQSPSTVIITDADGKIEYVNPEFTRMTGYAKEEAVGRNPGFLKSGTTSTAEYRRLWETIAAGKPWQGEFLNRKKGGELCWADASISPILNDRGEITHFVAIEEDITERKKTSESKYRLRKLQEAATEAIYVFLQTSRPQAMARVIAQSCADLLQVPLTFLAETGSNGPHLLAVAGKAAQAATEESLGLDLLRLLNRGPTFSAESGPLSPAMADYLESGNLSLISLRIAGEEIGVLGLLGKPGGFTETDRRDLDAFAPTAALTLQSARAEQARQQATDHLRVVQKFEAIGQLAGGVAHDFNNLLTVINGYSSLLVRGLADDDLNRRDAEAILQAGQKAENLTRQLLAFSRQQVMEAAVLDLNELFSNFRKILLRLVREDVEVIWNLAPDLGRIKADPGQMEQILINLVVNARDALPQGGRIAIETAAAVMDDRFVGVHPGSRPGAYVMFAVHDTGCGMTEEIRERVFEPFFTTKAPGRGTGLGLSTVYGIVKQSGGYITVDSTPGTGSTFRIYLPSIGEECEPATPPPPAVPRHVRGTVLLVEDEEEVLHLTAKLLEGYGLTVIGTSSPEEAFSLADEATGIDLLLTDMVMPGLSGPELADRLRERLPELKVLFMSGYGQFHGRSLTPAEAGACFLQKPFTPESLMEKVLAVLQGGRSRVADG